MNVKNLDLNTNLKLVGLVPLKLIGHCKTYAGGYQEHHFTITEVGTPCTTEVGSGYELTAADGSKEYFQTLKEALQQCYLNWGE